MRQALAACMFAAGCIVAPHGFAAAGGAAPALASPERVKVQAAVTQAVEHNAFFEGMPVQSVKLDGTDWVDRPGGRQLLVSATVRFKSLSNVYCGAAVVDADLASATLVMGTTPIQDCRRVAGVAFVDVNGDGAAILQKIVVPSNRDGTDAPLYAVYLPGKDAYCFSPAASEALQDAYPFEAKRLKIKLDAEKRRLNLGRYECGP